jgi:hypothetical protein
VTNSKIKKKNGKKSIFYDFSSIKTNFFKNQKLPIFFIRNEEMFKNSKDQIEFLTELNNKNETEIKFLKVKLLLIYS